MAAPSVESSSAQGLEKASYLVAAMIWSAQQETALHRVRQWLSDPNRPPYFYLGGYAGSGKTTLAKHFAEGVGGQVTFAAFTGKAAHVMARKGCVGATTIHRLIYLARSLSRQRLLELETELADVLKATESDAKRLSELRAQIKLERDALARPHFSLNPESQIIHSKLVVVDEASMVDGRMGQDLLSFGVPVLVLGDPAQLPPVRGTGNGFFTARDPDFMLDEVHRQAAESPVLALATDVRAGKKLVDGTYGESLVIDGRGLSREEKQGLATGVEQVLVGTNATRTQMNSWFRKLAGHGETYPVPGDRLVCLRNDHEHGLLNGSLWSVTEVEEVPGAPGTGGLVRMVVESLDDAGIRLYVDAHPQHFDGGTVQWWDRKSAQEFTYGYALTVHKAQGSQWASVLVVDQSRVFRQDARKWLYTAITRAEERVVVARGM